MYSTLKVMLAGASLAFFSAQAAADAEAAIRDSLSRILSEYEVSSIHETPIPGVYEVLLGSNVVYVSKDGKYMLQGRMIDLADRKDLTENSPRLAEARKRQAKARADAVENIGDSGMIVFAPDRYDHTVTVFTDIDCGYCRKLHREIEAYNDAGIRVRYLFYPRAGAGSPSYDKAVSVWCADDRQEAMTLAKSGKPVESKRCSNPVKEHMDLGEEFGISGTPAIVLSNGAMVPGYVPAKRLSKVIEAEGG
jgi:thiol:disulfide interchange protein DsbC